MAESAYTTARAGLSLVVENVNKFKTDLGAANTALGGLKSALSKVKNWLDNINTPLTDMFKNLGERIKDFSHNILERILVIAFGVLVRDAIRKVIDVMRELIGVFVDSANEFQRLSVRLNTFNIQPLIESGMSFKDAMEKSTDATREQLNWVIKLSKSTPYDATDVANAYSLARSYGFMDDKAKRLTDTIMDFASGMALDNTAIEKIITNFGQMMQQGKITGTELRDLARGAFVPVNEVLKLVAKNLGITTEELNKMRKAGTAKPEWFIDAFMQLVEKDFAGASERMSRTFKSSMENLKDTFIGLAGLKIGIPIFDVLGGKIADLVEAFDDLRYAKLSDTFDRIGKSISRIIDKIFGFLPGATSIADKIINVFDRVAYWLVNNEDEIAEWVKNAIDWLGNLYNIIVTNVIPAIAKLIGWVVENRDEIGKWAVNIGKAWLMLEAGVIIIRIVLGALIGLISAFTTAKAIIWAAKLVLSIFGVSLSEVLIPIAAIVLLGVALGKFIAQFVELGKRIKDAFVKEDWSLLGKSIADGILLGLQLAVPGLYSAVAFIAKSVMWIWNSFFKMKSPSKLMEESGGNIMAGLTKGITNGAEQVEKVTQGVAAQISGILSGTNLQKGVQKIGVGTSNYLNQGGEVMRAKLDSTKGGDPCGKGTPAGCIADRIKSALGGAGGIGAGIADLINGFGNQLLETVRGYATEDLKNASEFYKTGKEELARLVAQIATTPTIYEKVKDDITKLNTYATEDLKNKSAFFVSSVEEIQRLNNERARSSADIFIAKVIETNAVAESTLLSNSKFVIDMIQVLINAALTKINSGSILPQPTGNGRRTVVPTLYGSHPTSLMPYRAKGMSMSKTTNVTNNFTNAQSGKRITWDYENSQFWVGG